MAVQDHDYPVPWTSGLHRARTALAAWPDSWTQAVKAARGLLASDLFAFGLGGVLWSALIFVVIRAPG